MDKDININKYPKTKKYVCLYFHVHQPHRLSNFSAFDIGTSKTYFDGPVNFKNPDILSRVASRGYKKANQLMLNLISQNNLKVSYSLTGTLIEQLGQFAPEVIDQFRQMVDTGKTELIAETYYHSLSFFYSKPEFTRQVKKHVAMLGEYFQYQPRVFRNTELTYRNDMGEYLRELGFKGVYAEGWDPILDWRSPNYMYRGKYEPLSSEDKELATTNRFREPHSEIRLMLKNYRRSDDIAFRFQLHGWEGYPVTAAKFADWVRNEPGYLVNLAMDYETIGEHHREESGIFDFYRYLPDELGKHGIEFILPSDALEMFPAEDELNYPQIVSWADAERDLSAWNGNILQQRALESIYKIEDEVRSRLENLDEMERSNLLDVWGKLQTSDHFYYMSTKYWSDGDVHKYFSPYNSPYEAYINYMNVLRDFRVKYL